MQQRQLRLGDILDDYCTRERRLTNHAIVAMVGAEVKQTRCTTCDTEHEYKHAKVPRQRRKADSPAALYSQVAANAPKRVSASQAATPRAGDEHQAIEPSTGDDRLHEPDVPVAAAPPEPHAPRAARSEASESGEPGEAGGLGEAGEMGEEDDDDNRGNRDDEGPVHRPLIRASLPREGQPPPVRPIPDFTIRQPAGGRPGRFRPRHQRGGQPFQGDRSSGNGFGGQRNAGPRHGSGRPPQGAGGSRQGRRHGSGRKRSK